MEIDQIETFLAVATYGGFHRASKALHISQPAVSARVRMLEESLGASLFVRSKTHVTLSPAGKALRPHAESILRALSLARQVVHEQQPATSDILSISAGLSISTYLLPDILKKYRATNPKVMVSVRSGNSMQVLKMVLDAEVDVAANVAQACDMGISATQIEIRSECTLCAEADFFSYRGAQRRGTGNEGRNYSWLMISP